MKSPMIPALIESARTGLLTFLFAAAFFVIVFAIAAWDWVKACWDTLVLGKSEEEQLRDYLSND